LSSHTWALTALITVAGGIFAFIKWLDERALEQKEKRRQRYERLIDIIIGQEVDGHKPVVLQQIVAVWMLSEFREFEHITRKIFVDRDPAGSSTEAWLTQIHPEILKMLSER
jgi:hypothetical protein